MTNKTIRLIAEKDLPTLAGWWGYYHDSEYPLNLLSPIGLLVEDNQPEAAGFLYISNTLGGSICFADYCIVNPKLSKKGRESAISTLITAMIEMAKSMGSSMIIATVRIPKLISRMIKQGFANLGEVSLLARAL